MTARLERRVRSTDPDTSWVAAASMPDTQITELQAWILVTLRESPRTDTELLAEHGATVFTRQIRPATGQRVRTARKELELARLVRPTGETRPTPFGRQSQVWAVAK